MRVGQRSKNRGSLVLKSTLFVVENDVSLSCADSLFGPLDSSSARVLFLRACPPPRVSQSAARVVFLRASPLPPRESSSSPRVFLRRASPPPRGKSSFARVSSNTRKRPQRNHCHALVVVHKTLSSPKNPLGVVSEQQRMSPKGPSCLLCSATTQAEERGSETQKTAGHQ